MNLKLLFWLKIWYDENLKNAAFFKQNKKKEKKKNYTKKIENIDSIEIKLVLYCTVLNKWKEKEKKKIEISKLHWGTRQKEYAEEIEVSIHTNTFT